MDEGTPLARGDISTQSNTNSQGQLSTLQSSFKTSNFDEAASQNQYSEVRANDWKVSNNTTSKKDHHVSVEASTSTQRGVMLVEAETRTSDKENEKQKNLK